jgi:hypothetical protein
MKHTTTCKILRYKTNTKRIQVAVYDYYYNITLQFYNLKNDNLNMIDRKEIYISYNNDLKYNGIILGYINNLFLNLLKNLI